jgi:hypothetical protein
VYRARHLRMGRQFAITILHSEHCLHRKLIGRQVLRIAGAGEGTALLVPPRIIIPTTGTCPAQTRDRHTEPMGRSARILTWRAGQLASPLQRRASPHCVKSRYRISCDFSDTGFQPAARPMQLRTQVRVRANCRPSARGHGGTQRPGYRVAAAGGNCGAVATSKTHARRDVMRNGARPQSRIPQDGRRRHGAPHAVPGEPAFWQEGTYLRRGSRDHIS